MTDNNRLSNTDVQQSDYKQSTEDAEESGHPVYNVPRRFKSQCRLMLVLFVLATAVAVCLAAIGSVTFIGYAGLYC
jgi:hypothetical protein